VKHVSTEISLHALADNLKRLMSVLGVAETTKEKKLRGRKPFPDSKRN